MYSVILTELGIAVFNEEKLERAFSFSNNVKEYLSIKNKEAKNKISKIYSCISKSLIYTSGIKEAETAKVIENIQRDLNIALMNEILMICEKLKINYSEILRLAKTKWNFIN